MEKNKYFESMKDICEKYWSEVEKYKNEKTELVEQYGYDCPKLDEIYKKLKELKSENPYSRGEGKAMRAYSNSLILGLNDVVFSDSLWDDEIKDFVDSMKRAGVETFVYVDDSSAVMGNIHGIVKNGYGFGGLYEEFIPYSYGDREAKRLVFGIRFIRNY